MDIKNEYIEQLLERYFNAETTLEEEQTLRTFFSSSDVPARLEQWRALFVADSDETLGDDFDARILSMIAADGEAPTAVSGSAVSTAVSGSPVSTAVSGSAADAGAVKAQVVTLKSRLMPLFKAAAVIAIILTLGGALQAPFDSTWNTPEDYAQYQQELDSVATLSPVQAENGLQGQPATPDDGLRSTLSTSTEASAAN